MVLNLIESVSVVDGDTVRFIREHRRVASRCRWIDCPPVRSEWGKKSKAFVENLVSQGEFFIEEYGTDRFGRVLADWFIGSREFNVQVELIKNGLAIDFLPMVRYNLPKRGILLCCEILNAQYEAYQNKVGIWGDTEFIIPARRGIF